MHELLKKLAKLDLPESEYAIFGSGPLAIRGLKEANDLDTVVTDRLFNDLSERYGDEDPDRLVLEGGDIEIYPARNSLLDEPDSAIDRAETIESFRFVLLEDIIRWKEKMGRQKDLEHIQIIKGFLQQEN